MAIQLELTPIAALRDNYIWLASYGKDVLAVDPGEAQPVLDYLRASQLRLRAVIITHKHDDHIAGVPEICAAYPEAVVYGPASEAQQNTHQLLAGGDTIMPLPAAVELHVLPVPGHTSGHIALYGGGALFCGDALFSCGCGRQFEGDAADLMATMQLLASLDGSLKVCCGHEYTLANIRFALHVDPANAALRDWADKAAQLIEQGLPTVPVNLAQELTTNPFLRAGETAVRKAACQHANRQLSDDMQVLSELRRWKDNF